MERGEFIWDRIKHDDALFTSRSEFFLLGQSGCADIEALQTARLDVVRP